MSRNKQSQFVESYRLRKTDDKHARVYFGYKYNWSLMKKECLDLEEIFSGAKMGRESSLITQTIEDIVGDPGAVWADLVDYFWQTKEINKYESLCHEINRDIEKMLHVQQLQLTDINLEMFVAWCWYCMASRRSGGNFIFSNYPLLFFVSLTADTIECFWKLMQKCVFKDVVYGRPPFHLVRLVATVVADRSKFGFAIKWKSIKSSIITQVLQSFDLLQKYDWKCTEFIKNHIDTLNLFRTNDNKKKQYIENVVAILKESKGLKKCKHIPKIKPAFYTFDGKFNGDPRDVCTINFGNSNSLNAIDAIENSV